MSTPRTKPCTDGALTNQHNSQHNNPVTSACNMAFAKADKKQYLSGITSLELAARRDGWHDI
jgi:hypothetical protein